MSFSDADYRLNGIYKQRQQGFYMQRVKLPGGVISAEQAVKVAEIADTFARGRIHLTTRGSMELHWLTEADLPLVARQLASVGLDGRGAGGSAVRGVVCGSLSGANAPGLESLLRKIHRYFSGNPRFEQLPKKFKIAVEADTAGGRHLIQDLALVAAASVADAPAYDIWVAGGLGREPQPAFLLTEAVAEEQIIPLIEVVIRLYCARTPAGKRLKHLLQEIGQEEFRSLVLADPGSSCRLPLAPSPAPALLPALATPAHRLQAGVFAGELTGSDLLALAALATDRGDGILLVTGEQNINLHIRADADLEDARQELVYARFACVSRLERVAFRVCPGAHECRAGLAPTRDLATEIVAQMGPVGIKKSWAISGCHNSCTRPQLADVGIIASRLVNEKGERTPRFDLYRRNSSDAFAAAVGRGLSRQELLQAVVAIG